MVSQLQTRINEARTEARSLYFEVEKSRNRIQDANLAKTASLVAAIPKNYCNLTLYRTLKGHQNKIAAVCWSARTSLILSASQDGFMIVWDTISGYKKQAIELENQWVLTCAMAPSGLVAAAAGLDNACSLYQVGDHGYDRLDRPRAVLKGHTAYISQCEFLDDTVVVTASGDTTCATWEVSQGRKIADHIDHLGDVLSVSSTMNRHVFLSASADGYVKVWDTRTNQQPHSVYVSTSDINTVKSFQQETFATGSDDGIVRLFDLRSDCELSHYNLAAQFSGASGNTNTGGSPGTNLSTWKTGSTASLSNPEVTSIDFSSSGRLIYACYAEFGCLIWDALRNEVIGSLGNHTDGRISQVAVGGRGTAVATASWDAKIKIWSV